MSWKSLVKLGLSVTLVVLLFTRPANTQATISTERYDNSRTGANLNETFLNTSNVNASQFGKLFSYTVDGSQNKD